MDWSNLRATFAGVDLAALTPLHDFVLVKQNPEAGIIINPHVHMTKDYRWRSDRPKGLRTGVVVAVGRGDKISTAPEQRHPMHVQPGDTVVYPQTPTNDVMLNGELYSFLHEEQHVLAVLEPEEAAA